MRTHKSWLPESALQDCSVEQLLADMLRQWSARWFARQRARALGPVTRLSPFPAAADQTTWLAFDHDLAIGIGKSSRSTLAAMMLDVQPEAGSSTDTDRRVLSDLASAALDDLCRGLAQLFRLPPDARWGEIDGGAAPPIEEPRGCALGVVSGAPLLHLALSTELLIGLVKGPLLPPFPRTPLDPLSTGLAAQPVQVSAALGRCSLTLSDFAGLSEGDVLVFDLDANAPLRLSLDNGADRVGSCSVERDDDRFQLRLLEPLTRQSIQ